MSTKQGGKWPYPCQVLPSGLLLVFAKAEWGECQFLTNGGKKALEMIMMPVANGLLVGYSLCL